MSYSPYTVPPDRDAAWGSTLPTAVDPFSEDEDEDEDEDEVAFFAVAFFAAALGGTAFFTAGGGGTTTVAVAAVAGKACFGAALPFLGAGFKGGAGGVYGEDEEVEEDEEEATLPPETRRKGREVPLMVLVLGWSSPWLL